MRLLNKVFLIVLTMLHAGFLQAGVSLDTAAKQVARSTQGQVLGAKTVRVEDKEVHIIRVLTPDGRVQHLKVDAETGRVLGHSGNQ